MEDKSPTHTIRKQLIEVTFDTASEGYALQERVAELFYDKICPAMNALFDEFAAPHQHISLNELEIDCGLLAVKGWEDELLVHTLRALRLELLAANRIVSDPIVHKEIRIQEHLLHFVTYGYLSWTSHLKTLDALETVALDTGFIRILVARLRQHENAAGLLVSSFSIKFVDAVLVAIAKLRNVDINVIERISRKASSAKEKRLIQRRLLKLISLETVPIEKEIVSALESKVNLVDQQTIHSEEQSEIVAGEEIYVQNAGLVILHPFLPLLFEHCGLMRGGEWTDGDDSRFLASSVLQYLVSRSDASEVNSVLCKILCGVEIRASAIGDDQLSDDVKKACDDMITEVIAHWKVLKNTGSDAFRETFLQRNGRLSIVNGGWLLKVEQKSVDILLSHLPWGIGIIKLPWMREIIYTEWT